MTQAAPFAGSFVRTYRFFRARHGAAEALRLTENELLLRSAVAAGDVRVRWVCQAGEQSVRLERVHKCECGREHVEVLDELGGLLDVEDEDYRRECEAQLTL